MDVECVSETLDAWGGSFTKPQQSDVTELPSQASIARFSSSRLSSGQSCDGFTTGLLEHISRLQARHEQRIRHLFNEQEKCLLVALSPQRRPIMLQDDIKAPQAPEVPVPTAFGGSIGEPGLSPRSMTSTSPIDTSFEKKPMPPLPKEDAPFLPGQAVNAAEEHGDLSPCVLAVRKTDRIGVYAKQKEQLAILKTVKVRREGDARKYKQNANTFELELENLVQHPLFELAVAGLVILNALVIGLQADWQVKNVSESIPLVFYVLDISCTVLFTLEILLRLGVEKCDFLSKSNGNRLWNVLDSFIVALSLFDEVVLVLVVSQSDANVSFTRLFRTLRLARLLRMVKLVRFFNDLRVMVSGIAHSMKSLLWALLLLGLIMYIFALCLLQFVAMQLADSTPEDQLAESLRTYYSSLITTMRTLTMSITGGLDWSDASNPLGEMHGLLEFAFVFYVLFAILCVLNIVTGIFVETATKAYEEDESRLMLEDAKERTKAIEMMRVIFEETDADGSGDVNYAEFKTIFGDPRIQYCFRKVGLNLERESADGLFKILDFDGNNTVNLDEFILALQHFGGPARSIDLVRIHYEFRKLRRDVLLLNHGHAVRLSKVKY